MTTDTDQSPMSLQTLIGGSKKPPMTSEDIAFARHFVVTLPRCSSATGIGYTSKKTI